ncbi:MAG: flagellar protein FlgN [Phycisphaerae bacterium]|nr:flagellar protein FlgN [Phycisphaerae bacterium]
MTQAPIHTDESPVRGLAERIEGLLTALIAEHAALLDLASRQRDAIRAADTAGMDACLTEQRERLARIAGLEDDRRRLVDSVAPPAPGRSRGGGPITLAQLAALAGAAERDRLLALASELRHLIERVRKELSVIRLAAGSLMGHVEGVMKQVALRLSHAQTYGRRGAVEAHVTVVSSLDLTS